MTNTSIRTECQYDLAFPFHGSQTPAQRLSAIGAFMEEQGLKPDYYASGAASKLLESKVASLFGREAALWFPTGTMAQGIAARIYSAKTDLSEILLHPTSHLLLHENDGYHYAHGLRSKQLGEWPSVITAECLSGNAACAFVELPQRHNGGLLPSWDQLSLLKENASKQGLALHLDGARIWSCRPHYGNSTLAEITAGFSSIYVSLYKDIGAIGGAILIGDADFIVEAEKWRSRLGGLMVEPWPMVCDALRLIDQRLDQMTTFVERAQEIARHLRRIKGAVIEPDLPHVNMFHLKLPCAMQRAEKARDFVAQQTGVWLATRFWNYEGEHQCSMEVTFGETATKIPDSEFINAVELLIQRCTG